MSILMQLSSVALKGAAKATGEIAGIAGVAAGVDAVVELLKGRFVDHSSRLTRALERSSGRAWRSVEIALAGRSWWDRCKVALASNDDKAIRHQVQAYLDAHPLDGVEGHGPDFRGQCLAQLHAARKAGLLDKGRVDPGELARRVGDLARFGDQAGRVDAEMRTLGEVAVALRKEGYDALATFLTLRLASGPPLLLSSMRYFFQRELEKDQVLYRGLSYARLESLAEGQKLGFAGLAEALEQHGDRLEGLLAEVQAVVVETHANVLDMKAELARQGRQMQELGAAIFEALKGHQLERRELRGSDSLSIRDEGERRLVRDLIKRYRALPENDRKTMPAMLNAVGKLEVVSGEYEAAERDFRHLAQLVPDKEARAEAAHNAYRAALERRVWDEALASFTEAVKLDAARFAPFPVDKFEPERILGAGGFGVAFLCRNRHSSGRVVIKTLRREGLDRDLNEVFREAQALEELEHPAIIRIRDCDYADAARTRPFFVMDYFPGETLAEYVEKHGTLSTTELLPLARLMAAGLEAAHGKGILHRDVKPANVLVASPVASAPGVTPRGANATPLAKLIDFGLALRATSTPSTMRSSLDRTLAGSSIAGTLDYAAPEQMGKLKGVPVGTYSDVYGFGKTCCFALFGTPQPTYQHWQKLPRELADLLGRCLAEQPRERPQDFAEVLRELPGASTKEKDDRKSRKSAEMLLPLKSASPIYEAEAVQEVRPVVRAPRAKTQPRREEYEERDEPTPRKSSGGWVGTFFALALGLAVAVAGGVVLLGLGRTTVRPKNTLVSSKETKPAFEPIRADEFPQRLMELQTGSLERRKEVAARLSVTNPNVKQIAKREVTKGKAALLKGGGVPKSAVEKARQDDEIWQVSCALIPLMKEPDPEGRKLAAMACQRWGTLEDVEGLLDLLDDYATVQVDAVKALRHIGEEHVWPFLRARKSQKYAIEALAQIGTQKSVPELRKLAEGKPRNPDASRAIDQINAREGRKTAE